MKLSLFSASTAVAQTTPDDESMLLIQSLGLKDELPKPGYNMEGQYLTTMLKLVVMANSLCLETVFFNMKHHHQHQLMG